MNQFIPGDIIVAEKDQIGSCGKTLIRKGSIVKVKSAYNGFTPSYRVYKSISRERDYNYSDVKQVDFRPATDEEKIMYQNGIKNVSTDN